MTSYPTRTIAFLCELFHPPQPPSAEVAQRLHNRHFEAGDPPYSSFAVTPLGPVLANPPLRQGAASQVAFLADRMQFREELGAMTAEEFGARVRRVAGDAARERGLEAFLGQQVTIRSLVNPRRFESAVEYMRDGLLGFGDMVEVFEAEARILGLRLVFPPEEGRPIAHAVRVENYAQDPRSLYLENQASAGPIRVEDQLEEVERNVAAAYRFLVERTVAFVQAFDLRLEE